MGTRIATNVDSLRGLRSIAKANDLQSQTLTRLSTGTQINSGKDNPAGLIGSETLRSQITAIEQSIKNSNRANNVIGTADAALGEVNNLIDQIRGLVQEGVNQGALSGTEIAANQSQIDAALSAINRISGNTSFAGEKLLDGSKAFTTVISSTDKAKISDYQVNEALFGSSSTVNVDATVISAATQGALTYSDGNLTAATTLQVSGAKGSQVLFFGNGSTYTNVRDAINNTTDVTGVSASISTAAVANSYSINSSLATYTTALAGNNNDLVFTAKSLEPSSPISIQYWNPGANNSSILLGFVGSAIVVNLATDGSGAITSTAADVAAAINDWAGDLVGASNAAGNDGTGVVTTLSPQNLTSTAGKSISWADARQDAGASESTLKVKYDVSGNNTALSAAVVDNNGTKEITFNLATDSNGVATTTATQLKTFLDTDTSAGAQAARALVSATFSAGEDGTSVLGSTPSFHTLTGGTNATLTLSSTDYGSKQFVDVNTLNGSFDTDDSSSNAATRSVGSDIVARINGQLAYGDGLKASISTALLSASVSFNSTNNVALRNAVVTITGGGSLFQIGENVSSSGQVGVGIEAINTARLGGITGKLYELGSGAGKSLLDVGPNVQGSTLVDIISQARDRVATLRARLGSLQKNVISTNISSLSVALENISDARSSINDTDFAVETANLTKSQILSQAGISALQIANSAPQQVLTLLRG